MDNKLAIALLLIFAIGAGAAAYFFLLEDSSESTNDTASETTQETTPQGPTIVQTAQNNESLSTLVNAITAADLTSLLSEQNLSLTVFAPNNTAFTNIQETVDTLLEPANQEDLARVLTYHVLDEEVASSELTDGQILTTIRGELLKVRIIDDIVYINDAQVMSADISASNGIIHVIDTVLQPDEFGTILTTAQSSENLTTLTNGVEITELARSLADINESYTVFAPTDMAFAEIQNTIDTLFLSENLSDLQNVLEYHVIDSEVFSNELTDGQIITTLNGETLEIDITSEGTFIVANNSRAQVITADVTTLNGIVHIVDTVLLQ